MEATSKDYRISFFKPTTEIAKHNRSIVIWLVCIWAAAIFGFQILLRVIQKPTPEPAYTVFQEVWPSIGNGQASNLDLQKFAQSSLSVLAKNFIGADERAALQNGLSWASYKLCPADQKDELAGQLKQFEKTKAEAASITDENYVSLKNELAQYVSKILGLSAYDVRSTIISIELVSSGLNQFTDSNRERIPGIMEKYLIHNQSFLTDFSFLGFPFHYFYTAIFLLILFVGLCWLYCVRIDRRNKLLGIQD